MRILIANRGEIARRIIRTAHRVGHDTIAVYADPDTNTPFVAEATQSVRIGPADLAESYLSIERILDAAQQSEATAVHPGYGFLSENGDFASAVNEAGLTWIGPSPGAINSMGSKIEARRLAAAAGVPIIPGFDASQDPDDLARAATDIGYPVLIKAAAGGGGKGIRIAHEPADFEAALREASTEAERTFGDGDVIVEQYITRPRHVEVQIVADQHGNVIDLGTRECSVQRRYQKLLEEAPAPNLAEATRKGLRAAAIELARAIHYDSAGTVEFIVDDETGDYFFLEMNTRLQVEHGVTEEITGLDIVELMFRSASGEPLGLTEDDVVLSGHAIEVRVNAEDAADGFAPQPGTVTHLYVPEGVRWESGVELGTDVTPFYDPMIAKLITVGADRDAALRGMAAALEELIVGGVVTNTGFQRWLLEQAPIVAGSVTTRFVDEVNPPGPIDLADAALAAGNAWGAASDSQRAGPAWGSLTGFRLTPHSGPRKIFLVDRFATDHTVELDLAAPAAKSSVNLKQRSVAVNIDAYTHTFDVPTRSDHWTPVDSAGHKGPAAEVVAPYPAVVTEVLVDPGSEVGPGEVVVVIEAMKMLHSLTSVGQGVVDQIHVAVGESVASNQVLVTFVSSDPKSSPQEVQT